MKIEGSKDGRGRPTAVREELKEILENDTSGKPVCAPNCPKARPDRCNRSCPDIPEMISTDPQKHPVEPRVAPLVFELKRLELFQPCWSCEGHYDHSGALWKVPRVWFTCDSVAHLRVLANAVKGLHLRGALSVPWQVVLTFSDDQDANTTFSLEPNLVDSVPSLEKLQGDLKTIAEHLHRSVFTEAQKLSRTAG